MSTSPHTLHLNAEALYASLLTGVRRLVTPETVLVGVWSGGAWLVERLKADLGIDTPHGVISSALHRDDFSSRGMVSSKDATQLPFEVEGAHILLVDDVLYTGRTIRAVINELFDFGRPASVTLAVLVDRGGRQLPIEAALSAARITLPSEERVSLDRAEDGSFQFHFERV